MLNSKHVDELEKDEVYPTILIHGIGQAKTFMLDGEGNDAVDPDGKKITGWPLYFYVPELVIKLVVPIILSLITQKDCGLSKTAYNAVYDALEYIALRRMISVLRITAIVLLPSARRKKKKRFTTMFRLRAIPT